MYFLRTHLSVHFSKGNSCYRCGMCALHQLLQKLATLEVDKNLVHITTVTPHVCKSTVTLSPLVIQGNASNCSLQLNTADKLEVLDSL